MENEEILAYAEGLPQPIKQAIRLYYINAMTQQEIADKMEESLYRVRGYLSKGMFLIRLMAGDPELVKGINIIRGKGARNVPTERGIS